jgi:hypothetical protein
MTEVTSSGTGTSFGGNATFNEGLRSNRSTLGTGPIVPGMPRPPPPDGAVLRGRTHRGSCASVGSGMAHARVREFLGAGRVRPGMQRGRRNVGAGLDREVRDGLSRPAVAPTAVVVTSADGGMIGYRPAEHS